jgi:uncharacterized RDD family membrane protein YckC
MDGPSATGAHPAGILRRLAALCYDTLLLAAILFAATAAWLPFTGGEAITPQASGMLAYLYRAWLLLVAFAYFAVSWTRAGQTLGMRAWRIRLERAAGGTPGWLDAVVRFTLGASMALLAVLGLWFLREPGWSLAHVVAVMLLLPPLANLLWAAFDRDGRTLQDLASLTRVVRR